MWFLIKCIAQPTQKEGGDLGKEKKEKKKRKEEVTWAGLCVVVHISALTLGITKVERFQLSINGPMYRREREGNVRGGENRTQC